MRPSLIEFVERYISKNMCCVSKEYLEYMNTNIIEGKLQELVSSAKDRYQISTPACISVIERSLSILCIRKIANDY